MIKLPPDEAPAIAAGAAATMLALESRMRLPHPPAPSWLGATPIPTSDQVDLAQRRALGERAACEACGAPAEHGCARYCEANRA